MRIPEKATLDDLIAGDTLLVIRPRYLALRLMSHALTIAILLLFGGWSIVSASLSLKLLFVVLVFGAITMVAFSFRHLQRAGAFYFAADDNSIYFRREEDLELMAVPWDSCRRIGGSASAGGRTLSLIFERSDKIAWTALCHATVFQREETEVVIDALPDANALYAELEDLRQQVVCRQAGRPAKRYAA